MAINSFVIASIDYTIILLVSNILKYAIHNILALPKFLSL